jgi:hemolysin activation/secretion protein
MDNLDLGDQSEDFMICCDDTSHKSTDTWKTGLELHEDNLTTLSSCSSKFDNQYQVLTIVGENSEEFDDNNNPVLNPANIARGANHLAEDDTADSLANRAKIRLSAEEWNTIKAAIEHSTAIPIDASQNVLLGYHYALRKQSRQLEKERSEIRRRRDSTIEASGALRAERSNA